MQYLTEQSIMEPYNNMIAKCKVMSVEQPFHAHYSSRTKCCQIDSFSGEEVKIPPSFTRIGIPYLAIQYTKKVVILGDTDLLPVDDNSYFIYFSYESNGRLVFKEKQAYIRLANRFLNNYQAYVNRCSALTLINMLKHISERVYLLTNYSKLKPIIDSFQYSIICINEDLVYDVNDVHNNIYRLKVCIEHLLGDKNV